MNVADVVATGRVLAESLMTSTCRIFTTGDVTTDAETGEVVAVETDAVETRCKVRPAGTQGNPGDVGGIEVISTGFVVSVPFALDAQVMQRLVITASPDRTLVGKSLEIRQVARGDNISARRLMCEEVA